MIQFTASSSTFMWKNRIQIDILLHDSRYYMTYSHKYKLWFVDIPWIEVTLFVIDHIILIHYLICIWLIKWGKIRTHIYILLLCHNSRHFMTFSHVYRLWFVGIQWKEVTSFCLYHKILIYHIVWLLKRERTGHKFIYCFYFMIACNLWHTPMYADCALWTYHEKKFILVFF